MGVRSCAKVAALDLDKPKDRPQRGCPSSELNQEASGPLNLPPSFCPSSNGRVNRRYRCAQRPSSTKRILRLQVPGDDIAWIHAATVLSNWASSVDSCRAWVEHSPQIEVI